MDSERYYWTKWGLQKAMLKYREEYDYILYSGHIKWSLKLDETKE